MEGWKRLSSGRFPLPVHHGITRDNIRVFLPIVVLSSFERRKVLQERGFFLKKYFMIVIRYTRWAPALDNWKEKLEELVVAHRFEQHDALPVPELQEQGRIERGETAIAAFIKQMERDIDDWRTPGCGV